MQPPTPTDRLAVRERPKARTPILYQKWRSLLFLHWQYNVEAVQHTLPEGLHVDTFAGKAYLGIVPFFMEDVRPRLFPSIPGLSNFQELNVRTYVYDDRGTPGIWFYSLDANQWLAVQVARTIFRLPYFHAKMHKEINQETNEIMYWSQRSGADPLLITHFKYRPLLKTAVRRAEPLTLEFFLIERYILFTYSNWSRRLFTARVHHVPYPLINVEVDHRDKNMFSLDGLTKPNGPYDHAIMSPGVDVEVFGLEAVT
jgi:uncharacterized protein YqjF (DUF2071 family)